MRRRSALGFLGGLAAAALAACDDGRTSQVVPELVVDTRAIAFGAVRVATSQDRSFTLKSRSQASVTIAGAIVEDDPTSPGGAGAFAVASSVASIPGESEATLKVRYTPPAVGSHSAVLVLSSDDPDPKDARIAVALTGRGAVPSIRVVPECQAPCAGFTAIEDPPAIDFGERPALKRDPRGGFVHEPAWPTVTILNDGEAPLTLSSLAFEGDPGFATKETVDVAGAVIGRGSGQVVHVMFNPEGPKTTLAAELVVASDDPAHAEVRVALTGLKLPNRPPQACAAIVEADQPDGSIDYPTTAGVRAFDGTPPPVQPGRGAKIYLSAFSDHFASHPDERTLGDLSACTMDPEDGRAALTFAWTLLGRPAESSAVLSGEAAPEPTLAPDAIGDYAVRLTVTDSDGASASADVLFSAIPRRDLVVQLAWKASLVDLDVHLVRPCAAPSDCVFDTASDINGWSWGVTGGLFDWGTPNVTVDDPRLDLDDRGDRLIENVSLDHPESEPLCQGGPCRYEVFVHYFEDLRSNSGSKPRCPGIGAQSCAEGDLCGCTAPATCVSTRCVEPVLPDLKIFIKPTPTNAVPVVIPATPVALAGPCFLWHAATVTWNPDGTASAAEIGGPGAPELLYYGALGSSSFACAPNTAPSAPSPGYLPGTPPLYQ